MHIAHSSDQIAEIKTGYVSNEGSDIYYELSGSGECVVFIHGNFGDSRYWKYQVDPFSSKYQVLTYDIRNYGKSNKVDENSKFYNEDDLYSILSKLGIPSAHIIGFSMGAGIAIDFAIKYPSLCRTLVLVGPWISGYSSESTKILQHEYLRIYSYFISGGNNSASEYFLEESFLTKTMRHNRNEYLKEIIDSFDWSVFFTKKKAQQKNNQDVINSILCPILLITSENDLAPCKEIAKFISSEVKNVKIINIGEVGHFIMLEKPEAFNEITMDFLGEN